MISTIQDAKAFNVLCSDGRRRNARLYLDNPTSDSERTAASVKVNGLTVFGFIQATIEKDDYLFVAFQNGCNGNLLPAKDVLTYSETWPVVYSVIQFMPPYMPNDEDPPLFKNRKDAERYAAEEKRRYLDDMYDEEQEYETSGSAREGLIYITRKDVSHDLGWAIEIIEVQPCDLDEKDWHELFSPLVFNPTRIGN